MSVHHPHHLPAIPTHRPPSSSRLPTHWRLFSFPLSLRSHVGNKPDNFLVSVGPSQPVSPTLPLLPLPSFTVAVKPAEHTTHRRVNKVTHDVTVVYMRLETEKDGTWMKPKQGQADTRKPTGVRYCRKKHVWRAGWKEVEMERPGGEEDYVELRLVEGGDGFMEVVHTKGGKTGGRGKQRYVTVKGGAVYALALSPSLVRKSMEVQQVRMESRDGCTVLHHSSANQQPQRVAAATTPTSTVDRMEDREDDNRQAAMDVTLDDVPYLPAPLTLPSLRHVSCGDEVHEAQLLHPQPLYGFSSSSTTPLVVPPCSPTSSECSWPSPPLESQRGGYNSLASTCSTDSEEPDSVYSATSTPDLAPLRLSQRQHSSGLRMAQPFDLDNESGLNHLSHPSFSLPPPPSQSPTPSGLSLVLMHPGTGLEWPWQREPSFPSFLLKTSLW